MPYELKFPECLECRWFGSKRCRPCGAGEYFEEAIEDEELEDDLTEMPKGWSDDE